MSSRNLERRILVFLLEGSKHYSELKDEFVGAEEGRVSNQTLINVLKTLEAERKIRRRVQSDRTVVYSLTSVLENLVTWMFNGSLGLTIGGSVEIRIIAVISILSSLAYSYTIRMQLSFPPPPLSPFTLTVVVPEALLGVSFLVGGWGLWKHWRWIWYLLMAASIGHMSVIAILVGSIGLPLAFLLLFSPFGSLWLLLPIVVPVYLWYKRDILRSLIRN